MFCHVLICTYLERRVLILYLYSTKTHLKEQKPLQKSGVPDMKSLKT